MANTSANSFMYVFTRNIRDPNERAPHAMELRYVFNTLPESASQVDKDVADVISDYWVQFATTGNPNREGLPYWPAYTSETRQHQIIGAGGQALAVNAIAKTHQQLMVFVEPGFKVGIGGFGIAQVIHLRPDAVFDLHHN